MRIEPTKTIANGKRFAIERFELTPEMVKMQKLAALRAVQLHENYDLEPGSYTRLVDKKMNEVVMSDTPMERRTNVEVVAKARGDVLIAGLGIAMILRPILENPKVRTVTVVEKFGEVIHLNERAWPKLVKHPKLRVVNADIFCYEPHHGFDVIYFDIWNTIGQGNKAGMDALHKQFAPALNSGGWIESWRRADCQDDLNPATKNFYREFIQRNPLALLILGTDLRS